MHNNFKPIHLQEANKRLDYHVLAFENIGKEKKVFKKKPRTRSLWQKIMGWFAKD